MAWRIGKRSSRLALETAMRVTPGVRRHPVVIVRSEHLSGPYAARREVERVNAELRKMLSAEIADVPQAVLSQHVTNAEGPIESDRRCCESAEPAYHVS